MSLVRTDKEVAMQDLLVASRESVDHYRDAAEFLIDSNASELLRAIASQREPFVARLEEAVRTLGDLPKVPDPDKETGAMLIHHAEAFLSEDHVQEVLEQRINSEVQLTQCIIQAREAGLEQSFGNLLDEISAHLIQTEKALKSLLSQRAK